MRKIYLCFLLLLTCVICNNSFSQTNQTASFRIVGYVPNWIDLNAFSASFDFSKVTHLKYAFILPDANGNLYTNTDTTGVGALVSAAHANNVKVLGSFGGSTTQGPPTLTYYQSWETSTNQMANVAHNLVQFVLAAGMDGIDIDWEGPALDSYYPTFVSIINDSLRAHKMMFTCASGSWLPVPPPQSTLAMFDWVDAMAYDLYGTWTGPGQQSPYSWAQTLITMYTNGQYTLPASKVGLGLPFYAYEWTNNTSSGSQSLTYAQVLEQYPNANLSDTIRDGSNFYSYNGQPTIKQKTQLALKQVSGVMIWELAQDTIGSKSLLWTIAKTVDSAKVANFNANIMALSDSITKLNAMIVNDTITILTIENATQVVTVQGTQITFSMYPNPAGASVNLTSTTNIISYGLYNTNGVEVLNNANVNALQISIDLSGLPKGPYVLNVSTSAGPVTEKLLISKNVPN